MLGEPSKMDILQQITDSAGTGYLNRVYQRSFSLNVFQMNAIELMEVTQRVKDPKQGMALMMEKNREAGRQAHREVNRHVHNFVSSALTLVEHTRVFMRKHYSGTELLAIYEKQVTATFAQSPIAQFVQGLRNYMLHRGLPNSSMFMKFAADPTSMDGSSTMETGVQYETSSLLDWKDWKPVARTYLEQAGENLDLHEFAQEYMSLVNQFHGWLDARLADHHHSDLRELAQLQTQLEAISPTRPPPSPELIDTQDSVVEPFEFTAQQLSEIDKITYDLIGKIRELHFKNTPRGFPTERPTTTITDRDMIGPITFWGQEAGGEAAFMFIHREDKLYGWPESDYRSVDGLIDVVMRSTWARTRLSRKFVENAFIDWSRQQFNVGGPTFATTLSAAARSAVTAVELWAPIANMEVEERFDFGPVRIEPITSAVMESLRANAPLPRPGQEQQVAELFEKLRQEILGYAAVVVTMDTEPTLAQERGLRFAQDAIGLLRFFSPAAATSFIFSPVALAGAEYVPTSKLIVLREGGFSFIHGVLPQHVEHWRLSKQKISMLKTGLMDIAASLLILEGLSEFSLAVRASLLTYSKAATLVDPLDRLRNCISALEGILLKHEMEPRAHSVANRMSFLLAREEANRESVKQVVRQIYWLQEQPRLAEGRREDELTTVFTSYAYDALCVALDNTPTFDSKLQFVIEVDRVGMAP